jgi:hypothetical protein
MRFEKTFLPALVDLATASDSSIVWRRVVSREGRIKRAMTKSRAGLMRRLDLWMTSNFLDNEAHGPAASQMKRGLNKRKF